MYLEMTQMWDLMAQFLVPFMRVAAVFTVAPVLGSSAIPMYLRLAMAIPIAAWVGSLLPPVVDLIALDPLSLSGFLFIAGQLIIGIAIGFALRLVFSVLEIGGQIVSMQMGLGFAEMNDPQSGARVPALGHLYNITATLVFLSLDGHLHLVQLIVDSFTLLPIDQGSIKPLAAKELVDWGNTMFRSAVMLALPAMASLLSVNLAMGVMTRAVPQFNMMIAFPMMILVGLIILLVTLPQVIEHMETMLSSIWVTIAVILAYGV